MRFPILICVVISLFACQKSDEPVSFELTPVHFQIASHFPQLNYPSDNPPTKERIELGRHLYYDNTLARAEGLKGLACASCHLQDRSFTSDRSKAILPHVNLAWNSHFLWDGGEEGSLEDVMTFELLQFFNADIPSLSKSGKYPDLFRKAFEDGAITVENASLALAQFTRSMISDNSKYDRFEMNLEELNESEYNGYLIFNSERGDCFHCHSLPLTTDNDFHNIGLVDKFKDHLGRYGITGRTSDVGAFKTPTLRNIELTAPYMHDDRFQTLEEVIEHYNSGVLKSPSLDPIMTKPGKETGLHLTKQEKSDLKAFLLSLTDDSYMSDSRFATP